MIKWLENKKEIKKQKGLAWRERNKKAIDLMTLNFRYTADRMFSMKDFDREMKNYSTESKSHYWCGFQTRYGAITDYKEVNGNFTYLKFRVSYTGVDSYEYWFDKDTGNLLKQIQQRNNGQRFLTDWINDIYDKEIK